VPTYISLYKEHEDLEQLNEGSVRIITLQPTMIIGGGI
jgi:hypothetical protein